MRRARDTPADDAPRKDVDRNARRDRHRAGAARQYRP
jgi:hypothetical protein